MKQVICQKHKIQFQSPSTDEELLSGQFHDEIESLSEHAERYPNCRFWEDKN